MARRDLLKKLYNFADSDQIGRQIEDMNMQAIMRRRAHERRWYDNNFFDDGYHFRFVSKKTGRVIDSVNKSTGYIERAIPRASRQIRGVANLIFAPEYYPVVYPERVTQEQFRNVATGEINQQAYEERLEINKRIARLRGVWITKKWEDDLDLPLKLMDMLLLAAKNSISYLQIYTDAKNGKMCADVYDAFDLIHYGDKKWLSELPFITKASSWDFNEVLVSSMFDADKVDQLNPENSYATSEIKNAYMRARFGSRVNSDNNNSIIVRETFLQEFLGDENWTMMQKISKETGAMEGKSKGDMIMRHVFSAGGVTLHDECVDYDRYPFAEYRFEPGYLYQVPLIERFIPLNKSLDVVVTRLEKFINSMVTGIYLTRKGENMQINNFPGGQQLSYEGTPPTQMGITNPGQTPFAFLEFINNLIDEQGARTFTMNQLPQGVTANAAYETAQQREYLNMKFATKMLQKTITDISCLMLERAHKDIMEPENVEYAEDKRNQGFTVIGKEGYDAYHKINMQHTLPTDVVPLSKDVKVRVEVEPGLGLTMGGKKEAMNQIMDKLIQLFQLNFLSPDALSIVIKRFLETFGYGSTEEFMEGIENGVTQGTMNNTQIQQMQIAVVKALRDAKAVGAEAQQSLVDSTKIGVLQTLKDAGLLDQVGQQKGAQAQAEDLIKMYKDAPDDVRRQIENQLGLKPSVEEPIAPTQAASLVHLHNVVKGTHEMNNPPVEKVPNGQ